MKVTLTLKTGKDIHALLGLNVGGEEKFLGQLQEAYDEWVAPEKWSAFKAVEAVKKRFYPVKDASWDETYTLAIYHDYTWELRTHTDELIKQMNPPWFEKGQS